MRTKEEKNRERRRSVGCWDRLSLHRRARYSRLFSQVRCYQTICIHNLYLRSVHRWQKREGIYQPSSFLSPNSHGQDSSYGLTTLLQFKVLLFGSSAYQAGSQFLSPLLFPSENKDSGHWLVIWLHLRSRVQHQWASRVHQR